MKAIHKAVGSYTLCGRFLRDTMIAGDVPTCKYCIAGGVGPHKKQVAILKDTPSTEQVSATEAANEMWKDVVEAAKEAEQESQEELWKELMGLLIGNLKSNKSSYSNITKKFNITRKP